MKTRRRLATADGIRLISHPKWSNVQTVFSRAASDRDIRWRPPDDARTLQPEHAHRGSAPADGIAGRSAGGGRDRREQGWEHPRMEQRGDTRLWMDARRGAGDVGSRAAIRGRRPGPRRMRRRGATCGLKSATPAAAWSRTCSSGSSIRFSPRNSRAADSGSPRCWGSCAATGERSRSPASPAWGRDSACCFPPRARFPSRHPSPARRPAGRRVAGLRARPRRG